MSARIILPFLISISAFFSACSADEMPETDPQNLPVVTTSPVMIMGVSTASSGGNVTSEGSGIVTGRGLCIKNAPGASIADRVINSGTGAGSFAVSIDGLTPGTTYYLKAFATNNAGTGYGEELTFTQLSAGDEAVTVVVGSADSLYVFNAANGMLKWKKSIGSKVLSCTYGKGRIFVATEDKKLYSYDTTGVAGWQKTFTQSINALPVVTNNTLYVPTLNLFAALDPTTGSSRWQRTMDGVGSEFTVDGNVVYLSEGTTGLSALNANTGIEIWSVFQGPGFSRPAVTSDRVYFFFNNGNLICLNKNTGAEIWGIPDIAIGSIAPIITFHNGLLYYHNRSINAALNAIDASTSVTKWYKTGASYNGVYDLRTPLIYGEDLLFTSSNIVLRFNALTGNPVNYIIVGGNTIAGDITVAGNIFYTAGEKNGPPNYNMGQVYAVSLTTGLPLWQTLDRADFNSIPCVITRNDRMKRAGQEY